MELGNHAVKGSFQGSIIIESEFVWSPTACNSRKRATELAERGFCRFCGGDDKSQRNLGIYD